jgi:hypothetical protein
MNSEYRIAPRASVPHVFSWLHRCVGRMADEAGVRSRRVMFVRHLPVIFFGAPVSRHAA